jgi:glutamate racemase
MPEANYIYLGDTARLPYGSKSHETIARYAVSSAKFLHEQGAELLVIACNTATALALEDIQQAVPIPVIGVIQPGAQAVSKATSTLEKLSFRPVPIASDSMKLSFRPERSGVEKPASLPPQVNTPQSEFTKTTKTKDEGSVIPSEVPGAPGPDSGTWDEPPQVSPQAEVLVLATQATVQSHAYTRALHTLNLEAHEKACPLLVPLVEEGWINHPVTDEVLKIYLQEALTEAPKAQTLLLGCTHYPLLEPAIRRTLATLNHPLTIIDSAHATAQAVVAHLATENPTKKAPTTETAKNCTFYATDSIEKFERLGSAFLGQPVTGVRHIDLRE